MQSFDFRSLFTTQPQRQQVSGPGATSEWRIRPTTFAEDDQAPRFPAFQQAWKQGAGLTDLFGPEPFALHGTVAPSGGDNHRPNVAKVQTLLGKAGYVDIRDGDPNGAPSEMLDSAIRQFQQDNGLKVDGVLKPGGPTITALGGLLDGANQPQAKPAPQKGLFGEFNGGSAIAPIKPAATFDPQAQAKKWVGWSREQRRQQDQEILSQLGQARPADPYPAHTISEDGAFEHDKYAETLVRDSDPHETARYLKNVIAWNGDTGRGDVADLLGRFAKVDEAKAKVLQDALHQASGERIPFRIAPLGKGLADEAASEVAVTQPARNPWGNPADADRWEAGNMAKALLGRSDHTDAVTHFAGEFKRDPAAARAYTAAVYQDMAAASPKRAVQFADAMKAADLAEETEKAETRQGLVQVAQTDTGMKADASPPPPPPQAPAEKPQPPASPPADGQTPPPQQDGGEQVAQAGALLPRVVNGAAATAGGAMVLQNLEEWRKKNQSGDGPAQGSEKPTGSSMQPADPQPPVPGLEPPKQPAGNKTELKPPTIKLEGLGTPIPDPQRPNILIFPAQPGDPRDGILENRKGSPATKADIDRWRDEFLASNAGWEHAAGGRHQKTG